MNATQFRGKAWSGVTGFWQTLNGLRTGKDEHRRGDWAICYDRNNRNGDRLAREMQKKFHEFNTRKRHWSQDQEPLKSPKIVDMDYSNLPRLREKLRKGKYVVVVFIIPDTVQGSHLKVDITRHALFLQEPDNALTTDLSDMKQNDDESHITMDLQFICENTVDRNYNGVMNTFES